MKDYSKRYPYITPTRTGPSAVVMIALAVLYIVFLVVWGFVL